MVVLFVSCDPPPAYYFSFAGIRCTLQMKWCSMGAIAFENGASVVCTIASVQDSTLSSCPYRISSNRHVLWLNTDTFNEQWGARLMVWCPGSLVGFLDDWIVLVWFIDQLICWLISWLIWLAHWLVDGVNWLPHVVSSAPLVLTGFVHRTKFLLTQWEQSTVYSRIEQTRNKSLTTSTQGRKFTIAEPIWTKVFEQVPYSTAYCRAYLYEGLSKGRTNFLREYDPFKVCSCYIVIFQKRKEASFLRKGIASFVLANVAQGDTHSKRS